MKITYPITLTATATLLWLTFVPVLAQDEESKGPADAPRAAAKAADLFALLELGDVALNDEQSHRLETYEEDPTAGAVQLVTVNMDAADSADAMNLNLVPNQDLALMTTRRERRKAGDYSWYGEDAETGSSAMLVVQGDEIVGTIRASGRLYRVRPLGEGLHAVIEVDQTKIPKDHPQEYDELEPPGEGEDTSPLADTDTSPGSGGGCSPIDLIVAYTPQAKTQAGNINGLVQLAVDETNASYANSGIAPRVRLAHAYETNYVESGSMSTDRDRFRLPGDGHMDEVHNLRDSHGADVAILITGSGGFCGIAADILASEATAFAVVGQNCATGYYSFGHEIGHLQGARHNPEEDPSTTPYPHGHGRFHQVNGWRTVMSYDCPSGCTRVDYWSNPDVSYLGAATGTVTTHDNSRVLDETACTLAAFRSPAAGIDIALTPATLSLAKAETATLSATVRDGDTPLQGATVTFASGDSQVATVVSPAVTDAAGRASTTVAAGRKGRTSIEATVQGESDQAQVRVVPGASAGGLTAALLGSLWVLRRRSQPSA